MKDEISIRYRTLLAAVLTQACLDYIELARKHVVKGWTLNPHSRLCRRNRGVCDYDKKAEVVQLLEFLRSNQLDQFIDAASLQVSAGAIRERLLACA